MQIARALKPRGPNGSWGSATGGGTVVNVVVRARRRRRWDVDCGSEHARLAAVFGTMCREGDTGGDAGFMVTIAVREVVAVAPAKMAGQVAVAGRWEMAPGPENHCLCNPKRTARHSYRLPR